MCSPVKAWRTSCRRLGAFQELRDLLAVAEADVGLLPVRALPREAALTLDLAVHRRGAHAVDLGVEERLDRLFDFDLGGRHRDVEHDRLPVLFLQDGRLLGHERAADDVGESHRRASCRRSMAALVAITVVASITERADTRLAAMYDRPAMLRVERSRVGSTARSRTSVLPLAPRPLSIVAAALVLASLIDRASTTRSAPACTLNASASRSAPRAT